MRRVASVQNTMIGAPGSEIDIIRVLEMRYGLIPWAHVVAVGGFQWSYGKLMRGGNFVIHASGSFVCVHRNHLRAQKQCKFE